MIAASGLGARAGTFELRDITFTVPRGGYGVVIGAAGSGKTTLLETIAGIVAQTAGTLQLGEQRVDGVPPEHRGIGIVYQRGYLFPHLSVEQNVLYGARDAKFARGIADRLGVESLFRRNVSGLSGGERARRCSCSTSPTVRSTRGAGSSCAGRCAHCIASSASPCSR